MKVSPRKNADKQNEPNAGNDDFPTIASLPKKPPQAPQQHGATFQPVEVQAPEQLLQTDMAQQDFANALYSSLDLIPDVPYDLSEYKPQNQVDIPQFYPTMPNMKLLQPEFFRRYDLSTLFYIFFYFPGSAPQFFAGRELKQRGWRFHTKYQTWFHRISEVTESTSTYEIGKFEYFDHSTAEGWCIRQRNAFKFEYEYETE